ncbi:MoaD/ThiS family protein [Gordonia phosphorivorans]|uniref:MoaD/ThiS family protein n=1 Tax=Gordonia phosphorivorans TaxID=1056982 RepID=A0ABV6H839_9ACTN
MAETITVNYFAGLVDRTGCAREQLELAALTVADLRAAVRARHGEETGELVEHCSVLDGDALLRDGAAPIGAEVDLLPPFAGG